ncbi:outer membrane protein [Shimia isoporae]|nr:outer membrane beta-barrel protein [Shimia isoporae]
MKKATTMTAAAVAASLLAAPAFAHDWTGFYAGGQLNYSDDSIAGSSATSWNGGVQAGYNHDFGGWVVGGEAEMKFPGSDLGGAKFNDSIALKARVGYDLNGTLVYGTIGGVRGNMGLGGVDVSSNGLVYGIGVERPLSGNWTVGAEVLQSEYSNFASSGSSFYDTSASVRVNYRF